MNPIQILMKIQTGTPQFRISESTNETAPTYLYYGQSEVENDLAGIELGKSDNKQIRTTDEVNQVTTGDVIFSLISGRTTLVSERYNGYLFTQNYVKLIPSNKLDAKYLIYLLNENIEIKRQLQKSLQGSAIMKYTVKQIKDLLIPTLPKLEKQRLIGELYFNRLKLQALRNRATNAETTILLTQLREISSNE